MRCSHPGCFLWSSSSSSIFFSKCFRQEGRNTCYSAWRNSRLLLSTQPLFTIASSYCLSFVNSLFTLVTSIMVTVNKISWISVYEFLWSYFLPSWHCAVNSSCCSPKYRILHFNILISILFYTLSKPSSVLMLSSIMLTLLSIVSSTNLISISYMIFSSLCQFQLRDSWFFKYSVKDLFAASQLLRVTLCHQQFLPTPA